MTDARSVRREMVAVYCDAREQKLDSKIASRLVFMLASIGRAVEADEFERRLTRLEHHGRQDTP